jgi:hypothetical protein
VKSYDAMKRRAAVFGCSIVVATACGGLRQAAHFSGSEESRVVESWQVRDEVVTPPGYDLTGDVAASCTLREGRRTIDHEWLSDVDCSEARLVRALSEATAAAGGELLIGRYCSSHVEHQHDGMREMNVRCAASVARPRPGMLASRAAAKNAPREGPPGMPPERVALTDEPSASDAWRIRIDYKPLQASTAPRRAWRADLVRELANLPPSHARLGDVVARCDEGCDLQSVRNGVRVAAGRMGATDVVGIRCIERRAGYLCTASAAGYAIDPEMDPRAR